MGNIDKRTESISTVADKKKKGALSEHEVKEFARQSGADIIGIAPVDRFEMAPEGFHPTDAR